MCVVEGMPFEVVYTLSMLQSSLREIDTFDLTFSFTTLNNIDLDSAYTAVMCLRVADRAKIIWKEKWGFVFLCLWWYAFFMPNNAWITVINISSSVLCVRFCSHQGGTETKGFLTEAGMSKRIILNAKQTTPFLQHFEGTSFILSFKDLFL